MLVSLTRDGLVNGAIAAAEVDMSFDEYCELVANSLISGQSPDEVKAMLKSCQIDKYFSEEIGVRAESDGADLLRS